MFNGAHKKAMLLILCYCLIAIPEPSVAENPEDDILYMGIFPRRSATETVKMFTPMAEYLSQQLQRDVRLVTARNFNTFWKALSKGKFHLVHYNQYHYIRSHREYGHRAILINEEFNSATIAGAIMVRKDSGFNMLSDLRGKKVVFGGGPKAMQSFIIATHLLRQAGLKEGDYEFEFTKNPINAIFAPYFHQADAGGVGDKIFTLRAITRRIDSSKMKFLAIGEQLPHLPWAVNSMVSNDLASRIQEILANMEKTEQGRKILQRAELTDLRIAKDSDFNRHREITLEVLDESY